MIVFRFFFRALATVYFVLAASSSIAEGLACSDNFSERVCVKINSGTCDPSEARKYADRILLALEDAHPTLRKLACDVGRYDVEVSKIHGASIRKEDIVILQVDPIFFDAELPFEYNLDAYLGWSDGNSNIWAYSRSREPYSGLRFILYHELAHFLELSSGLEFQAFNCTEFERLSPILNELKLCWIEDRCLRGYSDHDMLAALEDLKSTSHISLYGLANHSEDFAELLATSLFLSETKASAHYGYNGKIVFDLNEALASDRMAEKLRIVSLMLDFPLDDSEKAETLMYENTICTGAFARAPAG